MNKNYKELFEVLFYSYGDASIECRWEYNEIKNKYEDRYYMFIDRHEFEISEQLYNNLKKEFSERKK